MSLELRPISIREAKRWCALRHSHLDPPQGALFAVAVAKGHDLVAVAILGRPESQALQQQGAVEITRTATTREPHAGSMSVMALVRAGRALGRRRFVTYTRPRRARDPLPRMWIPSRCAVEGGEWSRRKRRREKAEQPGIKVRWEYGPDALPMDPEVDRRVREAVGQVELPGRRQEELFG